MSIERRFAFHLSEINPWPPHDPLYLLRWMAWRAQCMASR